ncbi:S1C family serine protease [Magnetospirillum fulvum]|uniref:Serine protease Do n=1 Tax=Magnetospirillum fulvum TaxID=1082 RepID=A0A1H6IK72_MAGFU|nr:trypsin-like peptidase domain-containing protein [Magnetospirillum fulvum]SEH49861.1 serine protease Do [Magnetospirillum fulvum]
MTPPITRLARLCRRLFVAVAILVAAAPAVAADPDLPALVAAARAAGESAPDLARISLVQATSRQMLAVDGDIDFPFSVGLDLPLDAQPRDLAFALTGPVAETGRYVIVFDVALAKSSRKVRDVQDRTSRKIVSVDRIDNPAYLRAVKKFDVSATRVERAPDNTKLLMRYDEAQRKVATTPRYLEQPVFGPYQFKVADAECVKTLTVNYRLIDRVANTVRASVIDVVETERFTFAYNIDASDPNQGAYASDFSTERQVRDWERAPVLVTLSQVFDHALAPSVPVRPLGSVSALLDEIGRDRTRAAARAYDERYAERPLDDPRFDSVVVIYTPQALGSGFFVRPNIVMTNWHVVENSPIVELRTYDRRETFGQVIAKDVRLDLALVKVQDRGRVAPFFQGKGLKPGDSVDAIGHPKGQRYSITRGVVSAIRKARANTNPAQDGAEILYVQTDADINSGNSGGPLFLGDKVVGVNTYMMMQRVKGGDGAAPLPGLNFAVHYAEAKRFLDQSMRGD